MGAFNMMIILLINNNWHVVMDAAVHVHKDNQFLIYLYFLMFYVICVVYFFNLVIAVTIQAFTVLSKWDEQHQDDDDDASEKGERRPSMSTHMLFMGDSHGDENLKKYQNVKIYDF